MPVLKQTDHAGEVVWLGQTTAATDTLRATACDALDLDLAGVKGARHAGVTRPSCSRVKNLHPKGTEIRNTRQVSLLSAEELADIAADMGLDTLDPGLLGATLVLRGIPDLTHLPPSSRLQGPSGVTLTVDLENRPCVLPAREIEAVAPGHGARFKATARGRRGLVAWVERPGPLAVGDRMVLFVPDQRAWRP